MPIYSLLEAVEIKSKQIASELKERGRGKIYSKATVRIKYKLATNEATLVFEMLKRYGLIVNFRTIEIPIEEPISSSL